MSNTLGGILPGMSVVKIGGKRTIFQRATILNNMSRVRISVRPQKIQKMMRDAPSQLRSGADYSDMAENMI